MLSVLTTPEVDSLLAGDAPVAIGVSGGKDSSAVAFATIDHLDAVGHRGPRVLIHSDLGVTEWKASLPMCELLAKRLGLELIVVRRAKGDMMDRWEQRWADNVKRYAELSCVKLILPWSTPDMRFCTSEMKVAPICQELVARFPGQAILSVTGIRRQESDGRKNAPITKPQPKLTRTPRAKKGQPPIPPTSGLDWHPIPHWSLDEVLGYLASKNMPLHEAYTVHDLSRVSCVFCIMQNAKDRAAAAKCEENAPLYRRMVALEAASTFAFQGDNWLADTAPKLLDYKTREAILWAKAGGKDRERIESEIPKHLLYVKGWPTCIPSRPEAEMLCRVRRQVSVIVGLTVDFTEPAKLIERYRSLYEAKHGEAA